MLDKQNRPDDEQHESHDAQQFVQFRALLQERRKDAFKGRHTSVKIAGCTTAREQFSRPTTPEWGEGQGEGKCQ